MIDGPASRRAHVQATLYNYELFNGASVYIFMAGGITNISDSSAVLLLRKRALLHSTFGACR